MHIFISGVMQGSAPDGAFGDQDYRVRIIDALHHHCPDADVIDPWSLHPDGASYDADRIRETFMALMGLAGESDILIAYLPQASMGTAIELWTAYHSHTYVIVVTPMTNNWVVRITADEILPDMDSLLEYIEAGGLQRLLASRQHKSNLVDEQGSSV